MKANVSEAVIVVMAASLRGPGDPSNPAPAGFPSGPGRAYDRAMPTTGPLGLKGDLARDAIARTCASGLPARELFGEVGEKLRALVPYASAGWLSTDPATMLYTDAVVENVDGSLHLQFFENELTAPDFAKFGEIVRRPERVAVLSEVTDGTPELSARHRALHRPNGLSGELRAVFSTGGACWGVACLTRLEGEPDFTRAEAEFVGSLCDHVAHGLRTALLLAAVDEAPAAEAPGMVVLAPDGSVESVSARAEALLAELTPGGLELPDPVHAVALRARHAAEGVPRARVATRGGRWLVLHAACLRGGAGDRVAVMIEPARRAELASLVVELYELTEREQQVTQLLVRGLAIDEIAAALWLSRHTVRDHVKAIFAKVGVTSRPELTAKLFAEHFLPALDGP
jgi:DNA-binding CsgD family transcriptional regulator